MQTKYKNQTEWMRAYCAELEKRADYQPGRVNWQSAHFMYGRGFEPISAAQNVREDAAYLPAYIPRS